MVLHRDGLAHVHPPLRSVAVLVVVVVDGREQTLGGIALATASIAADDCHTARHGSKRLVEAHAGVEGHAAEETASAAAQGDGVVAERRQLRHLLARGPQTDETRTRLHATRSVEW